MSNLRPTSFQRRQIKTKNKMLFSGLGFWVPRSAGVPETKLIFRTSVASGSEVWRPAYGVVKLHMVSSQPDLHSQITVQ